MKENEEDQEKGVEGIRRDEEKRKEESNDRKVGTDRKDSRKNKEGNEIEEKAEGE
jgi:hypothetical protein